jgi:hypothetical protein
MPWSRKCVLGLSPDEYSFYSSVTKQNKRKEPRTTLFILAGRLQERRSHTKKLLCSSPGEDVEFRNNNFSYDIQRYVWNDQAYDKLSDNKDWYEM